MKTPATSALGARPSALLLILTSFICVTVAPAAPSARIAAALAVATDSSRPEVERIASIRRLGRAAYADVAPTLFALLQPNQGDPVRLAVIQTFVQLEEPASVRPLLEAWETHSPAVKQAVLHAVTSRKSLAGEFVAQLEGGRLSLAEVDTATRRRFTMLPDKTVAERARKLFAREPVMDARARFERFKGALKLTGDAGRGREVFRERMCFNCHRLGGEGTFVGADLFTVKDMPRDAMLRHILAPNLFFMPNFQVFVAEDEDGELVEGLMAGSNSVTVTLRRALGDESILHKKSLRRLKGINVSLMPEGLLEGLSDQRVADLLEFIRTSKGDEGVGLR